MSRFHFICLFLISCTSYSLREIYNFADKNAQVVGKSVISTDQVEYNTSFDPDGNKLFFTRNNLNWDSPELWSVTLINGKFQNAKIIQIDQLSGDYGDFHLSADGKFLFFSYSQKGKRADIWRAEKSNDRWINAIALDQSINSDADEFYPTVAANGNLFFASNRSGNMDIYMSNYSDGHYQKAQRLPEQINLSGFDGDPMISRDGSFLIFVRMNASDGFGVSDLYISFFENNQWSEAKNLGAKINSNGVDGSPCMSPDNRFLFFTSNRESDKPQQFDGKLDIYMIAFDPKNFR